VPVPYWEGCAAMQTTNMHPLIPTLAYAEKMQQEIAWSIMLKQKGRSNY
jgi:hypothetical protein